MFMRNSERRGRIVSNYAAANALTQPAFFLEIP